MARFRFLAPAAALTILLAGAAGSARAADGAPAARRSFATTPMQSGPSSHVLLPTSAAVDGAMGAVFRTRISIHNVTSRAYTIRAGFSGRSGEITAATFTIYGYETLTWDRFHEDVFGMGGAGAIDLDAGDAANRFVVNAEVYVDSANGRYSTAVQAGDEWSTVTPGHPGYIVGISVDQYDRTNVGCASDSGSWQRVTVDVLNREGDVVGRHAFDLAPFGWEQVSVTTSVVNGSLYVTAQGRAVCYGVVVDNVSNDGTYRLAVAE